MSGPAHDFTVAELAQGVLNAVVGQLSSVPLHYVGVAIGGAVGQQLLSDHPDRLASLTLIATTDCFPDPQGRNERADPVERAGTPTQVINSAKLWFAPDFLAQHAEVGTALLRDLQNAGRYSYAAACRSLAGFDLHETQPEAQVPVLALSGPSDVVAGPQTVRREALSDAHVGRAEAGKTEFTEEFQDFIIRYAWGEIGTRSSLDRRTRSACVLTALIAAGHWEGSEMRGGHLDRCVLGAFRVDQKGNLANWHSEKPGAIPAVGGAMDLATGAKQTFVMMALQTKKGQSKLVAQCDMPLTGAGCVSRTYTNKAVFLIEEGGVRVRETFGIGFDELTELIDIELEPAG